MRVNTEKKIASQIARRLNEVMKVQDLVYGDAPLILDLTQYMLVPFPISYLQGDDDSTPWLVGCFEDHVRCTLKILSTDSIVKSGGPEFLSLP